MCDAITTNDMKRVSFSVAKSLKEAGYKFTPAPNSFFTNETNSWYCKEDGELYSLPYAIEVWIWLWREKKYAVTLECIDNKDWATGQIGFFDDPEDAIIAEIQHIVDCKLLK